MNLLKYLILSLFLLNLPAICRVHYNPGLSSALSYLAFSLLLLYYFFVDKTKLNSWMIVIALLYFSISSISSQNFYFEKDIDYYIYIIKVFILIIPGYELIKRVTRGELFIFLIFGAVTIFLEILYFYDLKSGGRYSGFYLNPNNMGFICMIGYGLCFGIQNKKLRLIGTIIFSAAGLLTFSRTFLVVWLIINFISLRISLKNIRVLLVGFGLLLGLLTYNEFLPIKNVRLEQLDSLISGKSIESSGMAEDSRTKTWSYYYDAISDKPFFGNGLSTFSSGGITGDQGVHNAYLMILGESGIIVFLIFLSMYILIIKKSFFLFKKQPHLLIMITAFCLYIATNHNYFDMGYILLISMWIQFHSETGKSEIENISSANINMI